jgi:hypothetical protein
LSVYEDPTTRTRLEWCIHCYNKVDMSSLHTFLSINNYVVQDDLF